MQIKIIIAGSTGLVGSELLKLALEDQEISEVVSLVRRGSGITNPKLKEEVVDFDQLEKHKPVLEGDALFCCLGTTMKKAKTKENFKKVDYEYPLRLAEIVKEKCILQFHLISAMGANSKSSLFYNRVKGEVEEAISELKISSFNIYRPSLLMGDRKESRTGEKIGIVLAKFVNPFLVGGLRKYRGIKAIDVARAMLIRSKRTQDGFHVLTSDKIYDIAAAGE